MAMAWMAEAAALAPKATVSVALAEALVPKAVPFAPEALVLNPIETTLEALPEHDPPMATA
jgi:hypothetical protein